MVAPKRYPRKAPHWRIWPSIEEFEKTEKGTSRFFWSGGCFRVVLFLGSLSSVGCDYKGISINHSRFRKLGPISKINSKGIVKNFVLFILSPIVLGREHREQPGLQLVWIDKFTFPIETFCAKFSNLAIWGYLWKNAVHTCLKLEKTWIIIRLFAPQITLFTREGYILAETFWNFFDVVL